MQLCFDFDRVPIEAVVVPAAKRQSGRPTVRQSRGQMAYQSGRMAEMAVADRYLAAGYKLVAQRWRGKAGEIDVILKKDALLVFVEVKSSRDFARAAERISRRQMDRICMAACEYCGTLPTSQMTEMRMDAAFVDRFGRVEIIEAAFGAQ